MEHAESNTDDELDDYDFDEDAAETPDSKQDRGS